MSYSDNLPDVADWYRANTPDGSHTLEFQNVMEYAEHLQGKEVRHNVASVLRSKHGYYVFNDDKALETLLNVLREIVAAGRPLNTDNIQKGMQVAGYDYIEFLTTLTSQMRPPVKAGEGMRRAYPGGWADVTSNLANAYFFVVDGQRTIQGGQSVQLPGAK